MLYHLPCFTVWFCPSSASSLLHLLAEI
jgi:hypothetical protein